MNRFFLVGQKAHLPLSSWGCAGAMFAGAPVSWPIFYLRFEGRVRIDPLRDRCGFISTFANSVNKTRLCTSLFVLFLKVI